ncbi:unnamed protein product [Closterium sp. NIES-65]|nr:unnamed protein product [Closterium sp. NIES-65]
MAGRGARMGSGHGTAAAAAAADSSGGSAAVAGGGGGGSSLPGTTRLSSSVHPSTPAPGKFPGMPAGAGRMGGAYSRGWRGGEGTDSLLPASNALQTHLPLSGIDFPRSHTFHSGPSRPQFSQSSYPSQPSHPSQPSQSSYPSQPSQSSPPEPSRPRKSQSGPLYPRASKKNPSVRQHPLAPLDVGASLPLHPLYESTQQQQQQKQFPPESTPNNLLNPTASTKPFARTSSTSPNPNGTAYPGGSTVANPILTRLLLPKSPSEGAYSGRPPKSPTPHAASCFSPSEGANSGRLPRSPTPLAASCLSPSEGGAPSFSPSAASPSFSPLGPKRVGGGSGGGGGGGGNGNSGGGRGRGAAVGGGAVGGAAGGEGDSQPSHPPINTRLYPATTAAAAATTAAALAAAAAAAEAAPRPRRRVLTSGSDGAEAWRGSWGGAGGGAGGGAEGGGGGEGEGGMVLAEGGMGPGMGSGRSGRAEMGGSGRGGEGASVAGWELVVVEAVPGEGAYVHADVAALKRHRHYVDQLRLVNPATLSHTERLVFWINVYNALLLSTYITNGCPDTHLRRIALLQTASYSIGGHTVTATDIEFAILRAPAARPSPLAKALNATPFPADDPRQQWVVGETEPLVSFALSPGSLSAPVLRAYLPHSLLSQLEHARDLYLASCIGMTADNRVCLPRLLKWHASDFADSDAGLLEWALNQLPLPARITMARKLAMRRNPTLASCVDVASYDWTFGYIFDKASLNFDRRPSSASTTHSQS